MDYTEVIYLVSKSYADDSIGNKIPTTTKTMIQAKKNNVSTKEFYSAVSVGITPQFEFQIRKSNYNGADLIEYNNVTYHLIRTIDKSITDMVLVIGKKAGSK